MRFTFLSFCLFVSINVWAQAEQSINLLQWQGKQQSLPFQITEINDLREDKLAIGKTYHKKKHKDIQFNFLSDSEEMISKFIKRQFSQDKQDEIGLDIKQLEIKRINQGKKTADKLFLQCTFTKNGNALYKFSANNTITPSKNPKLNVTNYISRALTSALNNFKKEYLQSPDWKKIKPKSSGPKLSLEKTIFFNQFEPSGDTIALDVSKSLNKNDFTAQVNDEEEDDAFSHFLLTYSIKVNELNNKINLEIYPKGYFLRSKSWVKMKDSMNEHWLTHQQLLFDIGIYYNIQFRDSLKAASFSPGFYRTEINKIYNHFLKSYFNDMDNAQEETKFGTDLSAIKKWNSKYAVYLAVEAAVQAVEDTKKD